MGEVQAGAMLDGLLDLLEDDAGEDWEQWLLDAPGGQQELESEEPLAEWIASAASEDFLDNLEPLPAADVVPAVDESVLLCSSSSPHGDAGVGGHGAEEATTLRQKERLLTATEAKHAADDVVILQKPPLPSERTSTESQSGVEDNSCSMSKSKRKANSAPSMSQATDSVSGELVTRCPCGCGLDGVHNSMNASERRKIRLLRNRASASESRQRKKSYVAELEGRLKAAEAHLSSLQQTMSVLCMENGVLRQQHGQFQMDMAYLQAQLAQYQTKFGPLTLTQSSGEGGQGRERSVGDRKRKGSQSGAEVAKKTKAGDVGKEGRREGDEEGSGERAEPAALESDSLPSESLLIPTTLSGLSSSLPSLQLVRLYLLIFGLFPLLAFRCLPHQCRTQRHAKARAEKRGRRTCPKSRRQSHVTVMKQWKGGSKKQKWHWMVEKVKSERRRRRKVSDVASFDRMA